MRRVLILWFKCKRWNSDSSLSVLANNNAKVGEVSLFPFSTANSSWRVLVLDKWLLRQSVRQVLNFTIHFCLFLVALIVDSFICPRARPSEYFFLLHLKTHCHDFHSEFHLEERKSLVPVFRFQRSLNGRPRNPLGFSLPQQHSR